MSSSSCISGLFSSSSSGYRPLSSATGEAGLGSTTGGCAWPTLRPSQLSSCRRGSASTARSHYWNPSYENERVRQPTRAASFNTGFSARCTSRAHFRPSHLPTHVLQRWCSGPCGVTRPRGAKVVAATPNPSLKWSTNGTPPGPGRQYAVHCCQPGPGVVPLSPT
jgi:hypothetical protein